MNASRQVVELVGEELVQAEFEGALAVPEELPEPLLEELPELLELLEPLELLEVPPPLDELLELLLEEALGELLGAVTWIEKAGNPVVDGAVVGRYDNIAVTARIRCAGGARELAGGFTKGGPDGLVLDAEAQRGASGVSHRGLKAVAIIGSDPWRRVFPTRWGSWPPCQCPRLWRW